MMGQVMKAGIVTLGLDLTDQQYTQLSTYIELLLRWNKVFNLTAIRTPEEMLPLHLFDSLSVAHYLKGKTCLDVGSGAGLPGIPLAIVQPDRQFSLLDTNGKKTRFMQQAVIELGLKNVKVVHERVEKWSSDRLFDAIISRAFSSVEDFVSLTAMHLQEDGSLYAMKGCYPDDELSQLPVGYTVVSETALDIPQMSVDRFLIEIKKHG